MLYEEYYHYGPFLNKQHGYLTMHLDHKITHRRKCVQYAKYLMEMQLGRYLTDDETVDHKDRDKLNNNPANLQIILRGPHKALDVFRNKEQVFVCQLCGTEFILTGNKLHRAMKRVQQGRKGPFCSQLCANRAIKVVGISAFHSTEIVIEKHSLKDLPTT